MSNFIFKLSKEGKNVHTATDNNLIYNSEYPLLKIKDEGSGSVTLTNNEGEKVVNVHDMGYRPFFGLWIDDGSGYIKTPYWYLKTFPSNTSPHRVSYFATSRENDLLFVANVRYTGNPIFDPPTDPPNIEVDYKWLIFYDPLNE